MMIPTEGASISISSNTASTSGIGSKVAVSTSPLLRPPGCAISIDPSPFASRTIVTSRSAVYEGRESMDRPSGDVGSHLHARERDQSRGLIRALARLRGRRAQSGHVHHPAARGHDLAVFECSTGMSDLHPVDLGGV